MYPIRLGQILFFTAIFAASHFASTPAHAWAIPKSITTIEWDAWPRICQGEPRLRKKTSMPRDRVPPAITKQESDWTTKLGVWHFCTGYIYLLRAQAAPNLEERKQLLRYSMGDLHWVPKQITPDHPLAPMVSTALARGYSLIGESGKALEILEDLQKHHPGHPSIYSVYTAIYFDQKQYDKAIDILTSGNQATGDKVPELHYFLGVAYLKTGDIENARIYEKKAREGGYPFRYLTRKLAEYDAKHQATGE